MKGSAGVAHPWMKWLGGTALILVAVALLLLRRERSPSAAGDHERGANGRGEASANLPVAGPAHVAVARIPSFRRSEAPAAPHAQAIHIKDRARAEGGRVPPSSELFDSDPRDPVWAPAMEQALKDRLRQGGEILSNVGLKGVQLKAPECHTSTCRLELEYTSADLATAKSGGRFPEGEEPFGFLMRETGPFSRSSSDLRAEPTKVVDGVTHYRQVLYMLFGDEESDPARYAEWVTETQRRHAEYRRTKGPAVKVMGLPPPELR